MRIKIIRLAAAFFLTLFMVESAFAGSIRCGSYLISDGGVYPPSTYEVLKKCGEPTYRQGNTWIYEFRSKSRKELRFNQSGILTKII